MLDWLPYLRKDDFHIITKTKDGIRKGALVTIVSYDLVTRLAADFAAAAPKVAPGLLARPLTRRPRPRPRLPQAAAHALLLTGTPALSRPAELFTQLQALEPRLFKNFKEFGLPAKRRQQVCDGGDEGGDNSVAGERRQLLMKLYTETGLAKIKIVQEYVRDLLEADVKFLIFGHHAAMLDGIQHACEARPAPPRPAPPRPAPPRLSHLGEKAQFIRIDGSTPPAKRQELAERFQKDPRVKVAILGITAAGVGLTLHSASNVVFAELRWTPGEIAQAEDRAHRIGQKSAVNVRFLLARGSVDDVVWPLLRRKLEVLGSGRFKEASGTTLNGATGTTLEVDAQRGLKDLDPDLVRPVIGGLEGAGAEEEESESQRMPSQVLKPRGGKEKEKGRAAKKSTGGILDYFSKATDKAGDGSEAATEEETGSGDGRGKKGARAQRNSKARRTGGTGSDEGEAEWVGSSSSSEEEGGGEREEEDEDEEEWRPREEKEGGTGSGGEEGPGSAAAPRRRSTRAAAAAAAARVSAAASAPKEAASSPPPSSSTPAVPRRPSDAAPEVVDLESSSEGDAGTPEAKAGAGAGAGAGPGAMGSAGAATGTPARRGRLKRTRESDDEDEENEGGGEKAGEPAPSTAKRPAGAPGPGPAPGARPLFVGPPPPGWRGPGDPVPEGYMPARPEGWDPADPRPVYVDPSGVILAARRVAER
eukprot:tig00021012_g17003.t1